MLINEKKGWYFVQKFGVIPPHPPAPTIRFGRVYSFAFLDLQVRPITNLIAYLEGSMIHTVTCNYGLHQLIEEATHVLNSSPSCINLIFATQPKLVMASEFLGL